MKIAINGEIIDFSLEQEATIEEVVQSLQQWAFDQDCSITHLKLNGKDVYLHQMESWGTTGVETLETLDVEMTHHSEKLLIDLSTLKEYFYLYKEALSTEDSDLLEELSKEYFHIKNNLPRILEINSYLLEQHLFQPMETSGILQGKINESIKSLLQDEWDNVISMIAGRQEELLHPWKEGLRTANTLLSMKENLSQIPLWFQQGKDRQALDMIIVLSEMLSRLYRILMLKQKALENHDKLKDFTQDLQGILEELTQALDNQDSVLMGDLVEYEIVERLDSFPPLFQEVSQL